MATATASYAFADGDEVTTCVEVENDYPDALSEAVVTCVSLMREVMVSDICAQETDEDEQTD